MNKNQYNWGNPVINASTSGNYYAWSDLLDGIKVGYKTPSSSVFTSDPISLKWNSGQPTDLIKAQHPSLNTYSRIRLGEDDCAIVWQQRDSIDDNPLGDKYQIYYTRLKLQDGIITKYLPRFENNSLYIVDNIAWISDRFMTNPPDWVYTNNSFPNLYRAVEDVLQTTSPDTTLLKQRHFDRISWQTELVFDNYEQLLSYQFISNRSLFLKDEVDSGYAKNIFYIKSGADNYLTDPNLSQGCVTNPTMRYEYYNNGENTTNLTFKEYIYNQKNIWHVSTGHIEYPADTLVGIDGWGKAQILTANGWQPHLAEMPFIRNVQDWYKNRRIYESPPASPAPKIISSSQYFYKNFNKRETAYYFFGFRNSNERKNLSSSFWFADNNDKITIPKINILKQVGNFLKPQDTIYSDWFTVSLLKDMNFLGYGSPRHNIKMYIERQNDRRKYNVLYTPINNKKVTHHNYKVINGGSQKYRLVWIKTDPEAEFTEEIIVGGLPDVTDLMDDFDNNRFGKSSIGAQQGIIDLGIDDDSYKGKITVSIFPNPADEQVYVTAMLPYQSKGRIKFNNFIRNRKTSSRSLFHSCRRTKQRRLAERSSVGYAEFYN
ncbi:MAG: hypothetical protein HW421_3960 [Ignavibacteria bacterium]|nr:hypothetical protein [Ignavibacteria bacterium]